LLLTVGLRAVSLVSYGTDADFHISVLVKRRFRLNFNLRDQQGRILGLKKK